MNDLTALARLQQVSSNVLDYNNPVSTLQVAISDVIQLITDHAGFSSKSTKSEAAGGSGLALSPELAASCAEDFLRTAAFIRGLYNAIQDVCKPEQPAQVLYAGSGPIAILAVPLMAVLAPRQVQFTILDYHRESIDSVKSIVNSFGFADHVIACEVTDACSYVISEGCKPDIIITETMQACLEKEPQVMISRHLLKQAPDAILIPQSVRIDACLVDVVNEFDNKNREENKQRDLLGTVFELSADSIHSWSNISGEYLPAAEITIPGDRKPGVEPMLFTRIQVYKDHVLNDYDSGLTVPRPFPHYSASGDEDARIKFQYNVGNYPNLICEMQVGGQTH